MRLQLRSGCALWIAAAMLAAGCGGGSDNDHDAERYMPLAVGNTWLYELRLGALESDAGYSFGRRYTVTGPADLSEVDGVTVDTVDLDDGLTGSLVFAADGRSLQRQSDRGWTPALHLLGPIDILRLPVVEGSSQVVDDRSGIDSGADYDGDGINETLSVRTTLFAEGRENVEVPAGRFEDALRIRMTSRQTLSYSATGLETDALQWRETFWFAEDIGIVQSQVAGTDGTLESQRLVTYEIDGTRGGDSRAPAVATTLPTDGGTADGNTNASVIFDETVDPATLSEVVIELRDGDGALVDGSPFVTGRELGFFPYFVLPNGPYSARLTGSVRDITGNQTEHDVRWTFTVEGSEFDLSAQGKAQVDSARAGTRRSPVAPSAGQKRGRTTAALGSPR